MSSLLIKPILQHHRSRVSPIQLRDFNYTSGTNRRFLERERALFGDDRVLEIWEFRSHLEVVKSKAWDGGQQPGKKLGFKHRSAEGAGDTTGRAGFEDSASEEGTTGRTRVTSYPVQEPRGVSLESGYSTNLSVPTPAEEQQNHRTGELYIEYNRPRNGSRALQRGRQCRRHRSEEREERATREPERAWFTGDRSRLQVR